MTAIQLQHGPFAKAAPQGWPPMEFIVLCGVEDRVALVKKSTDAEWLEAVITHDETQKPVRVAAERRLRWVNKAVKGLIAKYKEQNPES